MESKTNDNRTERRKTGDIGEEAAANYLVKKGYSIIARNFKCKTGELDIVAMNSEGILAFVEVKSRKSTDYGLPCQAVSEKKRQRLIRTAQFFLLKNPQLRRFQPRMDIIELLRVDGQVYIRHLPNSF